MTQHIVRIIGGPEPLMEPCIRCLMVFSDDQAQSMTQECNKSAEQTKESPDGVSRD